MSYPSARGWGSGWPNCQSSSMVRLEVRGIGFGMVHRDIHELATLLIEESMDRGYQFKSGQCWGYNCRQIRGSTAPSVHSWGLALDFNSVYNYLGRSDGGDIPGWMVDLWETHGFFWGGHFSSRKDPMHFEFHGYRSGVGTLVDRLKRIREERADDMKFDEFREGWTAFVEGKPMKETWSAERKFGWRAARFAAGNHEKEG